MNIESDIELDVNGVDYYYEYSMTVEFDGNACSDADGNRGRPEFYAEDIRIQHVFDEDGNEVSTNDVLYNVLESHLNENVEEIARHYEGK